MELNGKCKRMSTMFNRIEKALSSQTEEVQHNALKALALVEAELNESKYFDISSFKYNNVCVSVKTSDRTTDGFITYTVLIELDSDFESYCKSMYYAKILREILDNKEAEQTAEEQTAEEQTESTEEQAENTTTKQSEHNKDYIVRVFENDKELTIPCSYFNKREYAIDYIQALYENNVVSRNVVFTINNSDIYDCFSDVNLTGTTAQIKYATDILNEFYKRLCNDIAFEYKIRVDEDIDVESKDFYANLNTYTTILKKVLAGNHARDVIRSKDKFEIWGGIYRTATNFIISYSADKPNRVIKHLENKIRKELFENIQILH